jgi:hypothetical protein
MRPNTIQTFAALDASVSHLSEIITTEFVIAVSVINVSTGTSTGTVNIRVSNDETNPVNWVVIPTTGTVPVTAASITLIPKLDLCYRWMQIQYVASNGSPGTITSNIQTYGY